MKEILQWLCGESSSSSLTERCVGEERVGRDKMGKDKMIRVIEK